LRPGAEAADKTNRRSPALREPSGLRWKSFIAWNPQPIDVELLHRGHEIEQRYRLSWWDSLIVGAAQLQNCVLLLTEDLPDRSVYGSVTVRNPFTFGVAEDLTHYSVEKAPARAYPRRGRPKRVKPAA
jgi:hypothetical protein